MKRCTRCVLPANYRNIRFDSEGVCNYCRTYEELEPRLRDFETLGRLRDQRLATAQAGNGEYDCLVGMSGGKDSSWIVLELARKRGLRVLGFTFDNGFLTDYARDNIQLLIDKLGVDHFFHEVDWDIHRQFYEQAVRWFGKPCPGCSYSSYALSYKLAFERNIPLVVHGRSRSQMFRELLAGSPDAFLPFVKLNLSPYDHAANLAATLDARQRLEYFISLAIKDEALRARFLEEFFPPPGAIEKAENLPEFVGYFLYQAYNEQKMMGELETELGWMRPEDRQLLTHADCAVHEAASYLHHQVFGHSMLCFELSVMIREGRMTREKAMERLGTESPLDQPPEKSLAYMCDRLCMERAEIAPIAKRLSKRNLWRNRWLHLKNRLTRPTLDFPEIR